MRMHVYMHLAFKELMGSVVKRSLSNNSNLKAFKFGAAMKILCGRTSNVDDSITEKDIPSDL